MRVYYIGGNYMGCYQVRCLLPMIENGWSGNYLGLEKKTKPIKLVAKEIQASDVVVFHRPNTNWHHRLGIIAKQLGKKIVFDNDDTFKLDNFHPFFNLDEKGFDENKDKLNNVLNNFALNSDLVTTSTEYLAEEYREFHDNVVVLPNCINPDDWEKPKRNEGDKVRIGLVGSTAYHHDFFRIKKLLKKLNKDPKVQIVLMGLVKKSSDNPKIAEVYNKEYGFFEKLKGLEHMSWVPMRNYFHALNSLKLDMMLIPRRENHFNRAKSNIKFLEASMLEIPVVAQSFDKGPYEEIKSGHNGILIKDDKEWEDAVYDLINNKQKRRKIGKRAKKYTINNYNIKDHAYKWREVYKKL